MQRSVDWLDRNPRTAATLNVLVTTMQGMLLGLAMGLFASLVTSGWPKVWTYATNALSVMALRVALQWVWVLGIIPWVGNLSRSFVERRTGQEIPEETRDEPSESRYVTTSTAPAIVALAIATILATEKMSPPWLNSIWATVALSALGGAVASLAEALAVPSNIYALRWNRHRYQETLGYKTRAKRNRGNRRR